MCSDRLDGTRPAGLVCLEEVSAVQAAARMLEAHGWLILGSSHQPSWEPKERSKYSSTPPPDCRHRRHMS